MANSLETGNPANQIRIFISPDEMSAYLVWIPREEEASPDPETLDKLLAQHGLNPPDREEILRQIKALGNKRGTLKIAAGRPPVHGEDARIIYRFQTGGVSPRPAELPDGRVDYYNLNTIQIVQKGDLLAEKIPPSPGIPGYTVTGKVLPAKAGKNLPLKGGQNTILSEDGLTLMAATTGQVLLQGDKVVVLPVLEVKGNVDFSIGNIDFPGSVTIKGNVEGFQVKALGNVEIGGSVALGSKIVAGGDVQVRGGILSEVIAGGKVTARFAEHAVIKAGDSVLIGDGVMYGHITAGKNLEVAGKGLLVGGTYLAGGDIIARIIGSHLATPTKLSAGVSIELQQEYHNTVVALGKKEAEAEALQKNINVLKDQILKGVPLTPERKARLVGFLSRLKALTAEIPELQQQERKLQREIAQQTKGKVEAKEIIYPGVDVYIGHSFLRTLDEYHRATLVVEDGEIKVR